MFLIELCESLKKSKVPYAIVGGYAVSLHGAVRGTIDIDLVICLREKDFEAVERSLKSIGLSPRLPVTAKEVFQYRKEYISKRNMIAWSFVDPQNPIRLVDIIITEDLSKMKSVEKIVQGKKIKVLAKNDLIKMKRKSGRPQDLEDIKALESL